MQQNSVEAGTTGSPPILKIGLTLLAAIILIAAARQLGGYLPQVTAQIEELGPWGPLAFVASYIVAVVSFVPGSVLTLTGGALFGLVEGTLVPRWAVSGMQV